MTSQAHPHPLRLVGVSSDMPPASATELPRPFFATEEMVGMIEGWAANAATHGNHEAWKVLQACLMWRTDERGR